MKKGYIQPQTQNYKQTPVVSTRKRGTANANLQMDEYVQNQLAQYDRALDSGTNQCPDCRQDIAHKHCLGVPNVRVCRGGGTETCVICDAVAPVCILLRWEYQASRSAAQSAVGTNGFSHWKWLKVYACEHCTDAIVAHGGHITGKSNADARANLKKTEGIMLSSGYADYGAQIPMNEYSERLEFT